MDDNQKTEKMIFHAIMTAPREKLIDLITALMEKATARKREVDALRSRVAQLEGLLGEAQQWVQGAMLRGLAVEALDVNRRIVLALTPPSPAGTSAPASGSTPAASSVTASSSEVEESRCGQSGTREPLGDCDAPDCDNDNCVRWHRGPKTPEALQ